MVSALARVHAYTKARHRFQFWVSLRHRPLFGASEKREGHSLTTYGEIVRTPKGWTIERIAPHAAIRLKNLFPKIARYDVAPFHLTGGPDLDADLFWFMQRYPLAMTEADRKSLDFGRVMFENNRAEVMQVLSKDWKPLDNCGFRPGQTPYPYQAAAAAVARKMGRLLLGDDMGLGKTITALAAISDKEYLPAAILVQAHLPTQWRDRIEEFTNLRTHIVRSTTPYEMQVADVYIFSYSKISGWVDYIQKWPFASVVYDEIQELRHGAETAKGAACVVLSEQAKLRLGLTATPIYNYGVEMYNVCSYLDPYALGERDEFIREWCSHTGGGHAIVNDPKALGSHLREINLFLRRTDEDVKNQVPKLNRLIHRVPYDKKIADSAEALARSLAIQITTGSFTERGEAAREFNALMRHTTGMAKADSVAAYVRILLYTGQSVLLVGWHRAVYARWMELLKDFEPVLYTGSESAKQKDAASDAFKTGKTKLMIMSLRSGAGLDGLQFNCHTVVFGELDWSPQVHAQVIGRLRRPGQTKVVDAVYIVANGGSDPTIVSMLGLKSSQSRGITDPFKEMEERESDPSRIKLLAERFLNNKLADVDEEISGTEKLQVA